MEMVVFIVYCVLSYWAVGQTIYANKIQIGSIFALQIHCDK